ncbi:MAG: 2-polyprenylphenol 6-hydroxylase [Rhodospirillales bacterium]|nr:2-polyprenylphenol 6-hydroxylase [Rhodospirillales bacterium]
MLLSLRMLARLAGIVRVLARHDPAAAFEILGLRGLPLWLLQRLGRGRGRGRAGERLAQALTELGPSFVKLGQSLSTRADLLGEELAADLSALQDQIPPFPFAAAKAVLEAELGAASEILFAMLEPQPVSAASIAQVHLGQVAEPGAEGEVPALRPVAVKILRPGIERAFERDLRLFFWLARLAERTQPRLRRLKPVAIVQLFADQIALEMDLRYEAAGLCEIAEHFEGDDSYLVPAVDWRRTARRVLTMSQVNGIPIDDRKALLESGLDLAEVLRTAATIFFKQVFRDGVFHGDQHPGNMMIDPEGRVVAVDFGILGRLDRETRLVLADMMIATLSRDYRRLAEIQVQAGYLPGDRSLDIFAQALRSVCEPIVDRPLQEISFAKLLAQLFQLTESFAMPVQPQLLLLQKNMMMAEGVSRSLCPDLNIWALAQPLIEDWIVMYRSPAARLAENGRNLNRLLARGPQFLSDLEAIAGEMRRGGLRLQGSRQDPADAWATRRMAQLALLVALFALLVVLFD